MTLVHCTKIGLSSMSYYAVAKGRVPGIYTTWKECEEQVKGFSSASYKKFPNKKDAKYFVEGIIPKEKIETTINGLVVFTDGACPDNGTEKARASWAICWPYNSLLDKKGLLPGVKQTNIRAELYAIMQAIKQANTISKTDQLHVYTDSEFSINVVEKWLEGWKERNYLNVKNRDLIKELDTLLNSRSKKPELHFVRSHSKGSDFASVWNNVADKAAVSVFGD